MKKIVVALCLFVVAVALAFGSSGQWSDFLRIHIRADSNNQADQNVKYAVKEQVVAYLAPLLANATTKQKAMEIVSNNIDGIQSVCNSVLAQNGFDYASNVKLCQETFPERSYDGVTLKSGVYDALIVELGSAKGDNWWCVVYPPLCFVNVGATGNGNIVLKSKLMEIINNFFGN